MYLKPVFKFFLKNLPICLFFNMVFVSAALLPLANNSQDFYFFSSWNMFAFGSKKPCFDITWDGGKTFLFRDHRQKATAAGINIHALFFLVQTQNITKINSAYLSKLQQYCLCNSLEMTTLDSSLYNHFVLKKVSDITHRVVF